MLTSEDVEAGGVGGLGATGSSSSICSRVVMLRYSRRVRCSGSVGRIGPRRGAPSPCRIATPVPGSSGGGVPMYTAGSGPSSGAPETVLMGRELNTREREPPLDSTADLGRRLPPLRRLRVDSPDASAETASPSRTRTWTSGERIRSARALLSLMPTVPRGVTSNRSAAAPSLRIGLAAPLALPVGTGCVDSSPSETPANTKETLLSTSSCRRACACSSSAATAASPRRCASTRLRWWLNSALASSSCRCISAVFFHCSSHVSCGAPSATGSSDDAGAARPIARRLSLRHVRRLKTVQLDMRSSSSAPPLCAPFGA